MAKAKEFDRETWLAAKEAKLAGAKAALEAGLKALNTSEDWERLLEMMAQVGALSVTRYSFTNQILIFSRRPGTARAATFKAWLDRKRCVKKGERGISILAPVFRPKDAASPDPDDRVTPIGFKPLTVFALEQTEGEPLPEVTLPDVVGEEAFEGSLERLGAVALAAKEKPVTAIALRSRAAGDPASANGWYDPRTKAIVVMTDGRTRAQQFRTLCHELAHALLHAEGDAHSRPEREIEAESTAFIVCYALGIDSGTYSFPYVATWAQGEDPLKAIAASGQRITTAATLILDALCGTEDGEKQDAA